MLALAAVEMSGSGKYMTKRGKEKYEHDGHLYCFDKYIENGAKKSWRCEVEFSKNNKCKGRIYTDAVTGEFLKLVRNHAHEGNAARVEVVRTLTSIRQRADETQETPAVIRIEETQELSVGALGQFPSREAVRLAIKRRRKDINAAPSQPIDRASIQLPENYKYYGENNENFVIGDSGLGDQDRILIFGKASVSDWIHLVTKIYVDGTFSLAPHLFSQVFVIMAERGGFVLPIIYALLPDKAERTYTRMLEMIQDSWPLFKPEKISLDFEIALINTFSSKFPNAEIQGCLFHLVKNMKRKLAEFHLMRRYNTDADFALYARMIPALSFVPIEELENALEVLSENLPNQLTPILDYFEDYYVGRIQRNNRRRRPTFKPEMWSCYARTLNNEGRTNNFAEAAHRRLQSEFGVSHPTLWKFIDGLRRVQKTIDQCYEQFVRGDEPPHKRNKYLRADMRIKVIVEDFENREIMEYLKGVAHNFAMD